MAKSSSTATRNGNAAVEVEPVLKEEELPSEEKAEEKKGIVNPYMQKLTPEMLSAPYPVEVTRGRIISSVDLALGKLEQSVTRSLNFETEEEWLNFARMLFPYRRREEERRTEEQADALLQHVKGKPLLLQCLIQRLNAELSSQQDNIPFPVPDYPQPKPAGEPPFDIARFT